MEQATSTFLCQRCLYRALGGESVKNVESLSVSTDQFYTQAPWTSRSPILDLSTFVATHITNWKQSSANYFLLLAPAQGTGNMRSESFAQFWGTMINIFYIMERAGRYSRVDCSHSNMEVYGSLSLYIYIYMCTYILHQFVLICHWVAPLNPCKKQHA